MRARTPREAPRGTGFQIVTRGEAFARTAAAFLAHRLRRLASADSISVALSGGSTPRPVYEVLAATSGLPWSRVEVFFADERAVHPSDPASNFALAQETLFASSLVRPAAVHRMEAERPDRAAAAREYAARLPERLDLLVLGVGEDGHIASLFPEDPLWTETSTLVLPVSDAPKPPPDRMSIGPMVVLNARLIVVLARGAAKRTAIRRALSPGSDPRECPARLARRGVWILDREAADL